MFYELKQKAKETMRSYAPQIYIASVICIVTASIIEKFNDTSGTAASAAVNGGVYGMIDAMVEYYTRLSIFQRGYLALFGVLLWIFSTVLGYGFTFYCLRASHGWDVGYGDLFDGFRHPVRILVADILKGLAVTAGCILFIVPGVILAFAYSQTTVLLADNPEMSAVEAMHESRMLMKGHKWEFFCLAFSFIGWAILAALTFGISEVYSAPYRECTFCNYYMDLSGTALKLDSDAYNGFDEFDSFDE